MKVFIVLSALAAVALAKPSSWASAVVPYGAYHHGGAPLGHDGRVVDTPEVAHAKIAHAAQYAHEAARNSHGAHAAYGAVPALAYGAAPALAYGGHYGVAPALAYSGYGYGYGHAAAPLGHDGRVVDTPEVAHAKAAHLVAHAQEAAKTAGYAYGAHGVAYGAHAHGAYAPALAYGAAPVYAHGYAHGAPIGHDGRVVDTPEVAHAKAAHFAAHAEASSRAHYW